MATGMTESPSCEFEDSDIIEIVPADEYDSQRAKLRASLAWLGSKAYGSQIPRDLKDPFYENSEGKLMLRPVIVNMLSSSELYSLACCNMFSDSHQQGRGHWGIIQRLSRKGIYIADVQDTAVTETVLVQTAPFRLKAHLSLIDGLMRAYMAEVASVERVVKAVRRITTFNASTDLPSSPEEALQFWVNKVGQALGSGGPLSVSTEEGGGQLLEGETSQKVRIMARSPSARDQPSPSKTVSVPPMDDLMRDIGDGCAIAAVIAYYRPGQLNTSDICLKSQIGIADSLYNLRQVGNFCKSHLPWASFHLSYEDFLYTHQTMRINIFTFVADLFYAFEVVAKPSLDKNETVPAAGRKSGQNFTPAPISSATKRSFQKLPLEETASNLGMTQRSPATPNPSHQPLLPRRTNAGAGAPSGNGEHRRGRRVQSLSTPQDRDLIQRSVIAWQDDQRLSTRTSVAGEEGSGGGFLANVSMADSELGRSMELDTGDLSLELSALDSPRVPNQSTLDNPSHPDYLQVESVQSILSGGHQPPSSSSRHSGHSTSHRSSSTSPLVNASTSTSPTITTSATVATSTNLDDGRAEPLMPAVLRPTKEKVMSKAEERGDRTPRKRGVSSPQLPSNLAQEVHRDGSAHSSWSDETSVTPLLPDVMSARGHPGNPGSTTPTRPHPQGKAPPPAKPYDAFVVGSNFSPANLEVTPRYGPSGRLSPPGSARSDAPSVAESYTVPDRPQTALEAVHAGIPIVSEDSETPRIPSREGSVASSGEYSDHESLKIHQDHKNRESVTPTQAPSTNQRPSKSDQGDDGGKQRMVITEQIADELKKKQGLGQSPASSHSVHTTNFAELKRLKDMKSLGKVDNYGLIYMQTGVHWDGNAADGQPGTLGSSNLARTAQNPQQGGDTAVKSSVTFQTPQTSWQQQQQQQNNSNSSNNNMVCDGGGVDGLAGGSNGGDDVAMETTPNSGSELSQLRLKLEQKRKEIERKKHRMEAQQNKMRQRLGKAAFMRVVSKHMDGPDASGTVSSTSGPEPPPLNSTQAQIQARLGHPGPRLPLAPSSSSSTSQLPSTVPFSSSSSLTNPAATSTAQSLYLSGQTSQQPFTLQSGGGSDRRMTDWSSQSQLARNLREKAQQQQETPQQTSSQQNNFSTTLPRALDNNGGGDQADRGSSSDASSVTSNTSSSSSSTRKQPITKTFSREGIQQTIDNVKNRWFRNDDADLISTARPGSDEDNVDGNAFPHPQQHHLRVSQPPPHAQSLSPPRSIPMIQPDLKASSSQQNITPTPSQFDTPPTTAPYYNHLDPTPHISAIRNNTVRASSTPPFSIPPSSSIATPRNRRSSDQDASLELLSSSLTDLQEEIMHMSLQNEQLIQTTTPSRFSRDATANVGMSDAFAAIGSTGTTGRPIHGIPPQGPYMMRSLTHSTSGGLQSEQQPYQQPMVIGEGGSPRNSSSSTVPFPHHTYPNQQAFGDVDGGTFNTTSQPPIVSKAASDNNIHQESLKLDPTTVTTADDEDDSIPRDGFFVSFGDNSQPRRPKPKLTDRTSGGGGGGAAGGDTPQRKSAPPAIGPEQGVSLTPKMSDQLDQDRERSQSPNIGFVVSDPDAQDKSGDTEMQRKKIKLLEMQRKRKEDQERKRMEKEAENARKLEEKMIKEEEQERKKAEEKARRDAIFQQYLHKKKNDDEPEGGGSGLGSSPGAANKSHGHRRERRSTSRPRPKSMFVKSKPMTPEPGAYGGRDSTSSSQEDLAGRGASPSLMSALRSSYHFRSPGKISMRKSVSCNQLPQNGSAGGAGGGASTYRRPPSPDLYRIRQQRQRGNSQDSGSETGSGSNPGSDYAGPKLFVKPSAKSNRHIIVNAISHCCLAGSVNTEIKNTVLQEMSKCDANHFLILFRDAGCKYRGLFIFYPDTEEAFKVHGVGPKHITNKMCEKFYKYNSGAKSFTEIVSTKHLSVSVDAVVLLGSVWKTGKAAIRR